MLKVRDLAAALGKSRDGVSHALARGTRRRMDDGRFREAVQELDRVVVEGVG